MQKNVDAIISRLPSLRQEYYRVFLIVGKSGAGKTKLLHEIRTSLDVPLLNVNLAITKQLITFSQMQRKTQVQRVFSDFIFQQSSETILLDNIEVIFDRELQIQPLDLLNRNARNKTLIASWPGYINDDKLFYAIPDHPEFKKYSTDNIAHIELSDTNSKFATGEA